MKFSSLGIICVVLIFLNQTVYSQESIQLLAGQSRTISVPARSQVNIGDPSVATARALPSRGQLIITGRSKGVTSLSIYLPGGGSEEKLIRVVERDPRAVLAEIREIYGEVEGVTFSLKGGEVAAEGAVYTIADLETFEAIRERYPQVINQVEDRSEKPMFKLKVQFVEVNRTNGVDFNNTALPIGRGSFSKTKGSALTWSFGAQASDLFERLAYWKSQGVVNVIAEPTLTVMNGDTATFLAGGEVPIVFQTRDGLSVTYKKYGIRLKVKPELKASGKILADVTAEVSGVDPSTANAETGSPGFRSRRVHSKGLVNEGETIVLAGLYQRSVEKQKRRVPILGYLLPFIFSSVKESETVKELIVMVTPETPIDFNIDDYPMIKKELQTSDKK